MVSCCSGGLAVRRAAAWSYVLGVKEDVCLKHVGLILKINKHCYLSHLVGLDFITLPTLKMHGQTQIKFTEHYWINGTLFGVAKDTVPMSDTSLSVM
jgi:hypothetical protein